MTFRRIRTLGLLGSVLAGLAVPVVSVRAADDESSTQRVPALSEQYYKSGSKILTVFKPVSTATRDSVAVLRAGDTRIALATVVDANGLLVTKASELKPGRITATFANGSRYDVSIVGTDSASDIALLRVPVRGLKPVQWESAPLVIGDWTATPGIESTPEAVGIVSVAARTIPRERALIGITLPREPGPAKISTVTPGFGAERAGLLEGDLITKVDSRTIATNEDLTAALKEYRVDDTIKVVAIRGAQTISVEITLTAESDVVASQLRRNGGPELQRSERMNRMGTAISDRSKDFALAVQHDTVLEPWQCGGPLVSLSGKAVGLNIARAGRVASYALPASLVTEVVSRLVAAEATIAQR